MDQYAAEYERAASDLRVRINRIDAQINQIESEASYVLTAPISGRVTALQARIGEQAQTGIPLAVILPEISAMFAE